MIPNAGRYRVGAVPKVLLFRSPLPIQVSLFRIVASVAMNKHTFLP